MDAEPAPVSVVVDIANVMGSRPDGWWRDRAGAALRLCQEIAALAERGVPVAELPAELTAGPTGATPVTVPVAFALVLEGRAREAADRFEVPHSLVRVVLAGGSGDDSIVAETASLVSKGDRCLVVTADRELRRRCEQAGAAVTGPGWILRLL